MLHGTDGQTPHNAVIGDMAIVTSICDGTRWNATPSLGDAREQETLAPALPRGEAGA